MPNDIDRLLAFEGEMVGDRRSCGVQPGNDGRQGPVVGMISESTLALRAILLALTLALAACSASVNSSNDAATASVTAMGPPDPAARSPSAEAGPQKPGTKVALLLPLTGSGQAEPVALAMRQAAELALFHGGSAPIQLMVKDDKGTPEGAKAAADEAIREGAEIILGPLFAKSVTAATDVAKAAQVPVIAFSSDRQVAGRGAWLMSFMPEHEVHRIVGYAATQGRKRMAALIPTDAYGRLVERAFREATAKHGVQIIASETYQPTATGLAAGTKTLRDRFADAASKGGIDALFLPVPAEQLVQLSGLLPLTGIDFGQVKILGSGGWESADFSSLPPLHGAWYAASDPAGWKEFAERFGKTYGMMPPRLAALGYDAVGIASTLATQPKGERYSAQNLMRPNGFMGVEGQIRLVADGTSERSLAIIEVGQAGPRVIEAATVAAPAASARMTGIFSNLN